MKRREALGKITVLSAGAFMVLTGAPYGCNPDTKKRTALTEQDIPLLNEISDTIIPPTATLPGGKAAGIGGYMLLMVNDCYTEKRRDIFIEGLNTLDEACQEKHKASFIQLSSEHRKAFLQQLNEEARMKNNEKEHYFGMLKSLAINGYITSEDVAKKAFQYDPVPGSFEGCIPYAKGDKPWSVG